MLVKVECDTKTIDLRLYSVIVEMVLGLKSNRDAYKMGDAPSLKFLKLRVRGQVLAFRGTTARPVLLGDIGEPRLNGVLAIKNHNILRLCFNKLQMQVV